MNLQSTTDFVLEIVPESEIDDARLLDIVLNYATFLKQENQLGFFVPCDENGNVLSEPTDYKRFEVLGSTFLDKEQKKLCQEYLKAKERVLFKGFRIEKSTSIGSENEIHLVRNDGPQVWGDVVDGKLQMRYPKLFAKSIEQLVSNYKPIELTESAEKKIGIINK